MNESQAGIKLILETEKLVYNAGEKIVTKPIGKKIRIKDNKAEFILGSKFKKIKDTLDKFGLRCIIPLKEYSEINGGKVLAWLVVNKNKVPAIVDKKDRIEFAFDIGKTFLDLVNERYFKGKKDLHNLSNPAIEKLYKSVPYWMRKYVYKRYYKKLHNALKEVSGFKTSFPIDPAGYVLHSALVETIKKNSEFAKIGYWPNKYKAAFMLTHDIDPTKYTYKQGIFILSRKLRNHKSTMNFVGKYTGQYLRRFDTENEIGCHGYIHDREFSSISKNQREIRIRKAKNILENFFRRKIIGFRAPALQKTKDLYGILWKSGFEYDSSAIDSQREEPACGSGVSYNLPYYIFDFENKKFEEVLEIPISAPDCISPIYFGHSLKKTAELFELKAKWISEIGGVCNFIIHAPAWGNDDAKQRMWLLDRIQNIDKREFWIATGNEINKWWRERRDIDMSIKGNKIKLKSKHKIKNLIILSKARRYKINLEAGKETILNMK